MDCPTPTELAGAVTELGELNDMVFHAAVGLNALSKWPDKERDSYWREDDKLRACWEIVQTFVGVKQAISAERKAKEIQKS